MLLVFVLQNVWTWGSLTLMSWSKSSNKDVISLQLTVNSLWKYCQHKLKRLLVKRRVLKRKVKAGSVKACEGLCRLKIMRHTNAVGSTRNKSQTACQTTPSKPWLDRLSVVSSEMRSKQRTIDNRRTPPVTSKRRTLGRRADLKPALQSTRAKLTKKTRLSQICVLWEVLVSMQSLGYCSRTCEEKERQGNASSKDLNGWRGYWHLQTVWAQMRDECLIKFILI